LNRSRHFKRFTYIVCLFLAAVIVWGCSKDDPVAVVDDSYVDAFIIIPSPLSPKPGDITVLTVTAEGKGAWADYSWYVDGGTLQSDSGPAVLWEAPEVTGTYKVRAIVSLGAIADTVQKTILVRNYDEIDTGVEISAQPYLINGDLLFAGISMDYLEHEPFLGYNIYRYEDSTISTNLTSDCPQICSGNNFHSYYPAVGQILTSYVTPSAPRQYAENLVLWDIDGVAPAIGLTSEFPSTYVQRASQNKRATGSDDLNMIVWESQKVNHDYDDGTRDTINIYFMNRALDSVTVLTGSIDSMVQVDYGETTMVYDYYSNVRPMITPQEGQVLYFVDSTGVFEPCLIDIVGGLPDTTTREAIMIEGEDYGIFEEAGIEIDDATIFEWRPVTQDVLAFIGADGRLCFFYPQSANVQKLEDIGAVSEFAWSPDGEQFAVVTEEGLAVGMTASGAVSTVFAKEEATDDIIGMAWSPDPFDPKIAFRQVRKGKSSMEAYSSIVIYSFNEDDWYYALARVDWQKELEVGYDFKRLIFEPDNDGIYAPIPTADGRCVIYHSYR
jgi:hypothetical protein